MTIRRVFTVGKDSGLVNAAATVASLFFPDETIQVINLAENKAFEGAADESIETLIVIGHANTEWYGNYSANAFAHQFEMHFNEMQKKSVKHLYLIGCEIGLIRKTGESLAQEIANTLYALHFTNLQVHSIAQPDDVVGQFMYVDVIQRVGALTFSHAQPGFINAYLLGKEDATRLNQLLADKKRNEDEIDRIVRERAMPFIKERHPVDELNKPHNIFIPNEIPAARQRRIAEHPHSLLSREQKLAIDLIIQRRDYLASHNHKKMAKKLNFIINQLKKAKPEDSQGLIKQYVRYLSMRFLGLTVNKGSHSLKLLTHLSEGCFSKAQELIDKQNMKQSHRVIKNDGVLHKITLQKESSKQTNHPYNDEKRGIELKNAVHLRLIKKEIFDLMNNLDDEITKLSQHCFFFMHRYEIHTKAEKKQALKELYKLSDLSEIQMRATDFMLNEPRVMRSQKTTRTRDLLEKIVYHPEAFVKKANQRIRAKYS